MLMPTPIPSSLVPRFNRNVQFRAPRSNADRSGKIIYSNYALPRWFAVGWNDENGHVFAAHLKLVSVESIERGTDKKLAILVKNKLNKSYVLHFQKQCPFYLSPIAYSVEKCGGLKDVKLAMVARFGKILFQGVNLESFSEGCLKETTLRNLKRIFCTNLPASYAANIISEVALKIGVDFADVKDSYLVKLSDRTQPDSTIFCKCRVNDGKKIQLYKIELSPVRDMVTDISCMDMDLDLRLGLTHKRILSSLPEDEMQSIQNLIDSAILDSDVKGGLRWPFGKTSSGNGYTVVCVWHTNATAYKNATTRLKVQHADRFDFKTSYGESSDEVVLKLKGVASGLLAQDVEANAIADKLEENMSLIWRHFLQCEPFLT
ncbi:hypothetical protein V6N13_014861 [Hibiscus sabdariffa]|uniref:DUF7903 domain-containing protein n=1 Tax=Hibiscus sabdariffa TaxID=183260 RepID=A0ABR2RX82_9ROSI